MLAVVFRERSRLLRPVRAQWDTEVGALEGLSMIHGTSPRNLSWKARQFSKDIYLEHIRPAPHRLGIAP